MFVPGEVENETGCSYDSVGNPTAVYTGLTAPLNLSALPENGNYAVTRYEYNGLGQLVKETDALGQSTIYVNDLAGQVKQKTDRNGNTTSYSYNVRGDLLGQSVTADGETLALTNTYGKSGLLRQTADNAGTTSYTYNALGQLTEEETGNIINTYSYDIYGNRTGFTLVNAGQAVLQNSYAYDNLNRLTGVTNAGETTTYTYNANGNVTSEWTGTSRQIYYTYNAAGLLTEKENVLGSSVAMETGYSYNLDGNIRQEAELYGTTITSYSYDGMGRVVSETVGGVTTSYTYDAYSNRATKSSGTGSTAVVTSYTYDQNNRLQEECETAAGAETSSTYTYDANGNQLGKIVYNAASEQVINTYDGLNRLVSAIRYEGADAYNASYTYNAAGIRTSKTVNGVTTQHLLDGVNVAADVTNGQMTSFVRGLGLISMSANGAKSYYVTDGHGDVRALTDASGAVTKRYDYDAFGVEKGESSSDTNPFRYCGEYYDKESGSIYLRARYYDARVGRFGAEDPARDGDNWYVYGNNNPLRYKDPLGTWAADGSDENFKNNNPIVYQALSDLSQAWLNLDNLERQGYDIGDLKEKVGKMADTVRKIGNQIIVSEPDAPWSESVYGGLNATEKVIFASDKVRGAILGASAVEAQNYLDERYTNQADGSTANAVKHAMWNAMAIYNGAGPEFTELFTTAHELGNPNNFINGDNLALTKMDFFNNEVGRYQGLLGINNGYTRWQVQENVNSRAYVGGLVIIN